MMRDERPDIGSGSDVNDLNFLFHCTRFINEAHEIASVSHGNRRFDDKSRIDVFAQRIL